MAVKKHGKPTTKCLLLTFSAAPQDVLWGEIAAFLHMGVSVESIAERLKCSRGVVYNVKRLPPPSTRVRERRPNTAAKKRVAARRSRVLSLITKKRTVVGKRVLFSPGRPRKDGTPRPQRTVTHRFVKPMYASPSAVCRQLNQEAGRKLCSPATVRRDALARGLKAFVRPKRPLLSEGDAPCRLRFANRILRNPKPWFSLLLFSDEKWFHVSDFGTSFQWCRTRKQAVPREQVGNCKEKVFVWGCIGVNARFIAVVDVSAESMDHDMYIQKCLVPARRMLKDHILMQDGATCHWTEDVTAKLASLKCEPLVGWPSHSPDLNPLENTWSMLQRSVSERGPFSARELTQYVVEEFHKIPTEVLNSLVLSFKDRLQACRAARGGPTKY